MATTCIFKKIVDIVIKDKDENYLLIKYQNTAEDVWDIPSKEIITTETKAEIQHLLSDNFGTNAFLVQDKSPIILREEVLESLTTLDCTEVDIEKHIYLVEFVGQNKNIKIQNTSIENVKWVKYCDLEHNLASKMQWNYIQASMIFFIERGYIDIDKI
ncbi:MAG: hypothetical protein R3B92_00610 [Patescibacteria group bacterium]